MHVNVTNLALHSLLVIATLLQVRNSIFDRNNVVTYAEKSATNMSSNRTVKLTVGSSAGQGHAR